jgi:hypothetical protein
LLFSILSLIIAISNTLLSLLISLFEALHIAANTTVSTANSQQVLFDYSIKEVPLQSGFPLGLKMNPFVHQEFAAVSLQA